jgi:NADH dehydrogenase
MLPGRCVKPEKHVQTPRNQTETIGREIPLNRELGLCERAIAPYESRMGTVDPRPHVVIVGGGFGGITAAQSLAGADVRITLIDRTNHHLFQPLLYQVATAGLSPADIAGPIRGILSKQENASVLLAEVTRIDLNARRVHLQDGALDYDFLILAAGFKTNYFGHDEWETDAPGLKSLAEALEIRKRILLSFEHAERETDPKERERRLTFAVIGGGATGVEMAGAIAELSRFALARDFRAISPKESRVVLIDAGARLLSAFPGDLSESATIQLRELGVEVRRDTRVTKVDARGINVAEIGPDGRVREQHAQERIDAGVVVWAAGVQATSLTKSLGVPLDSNGRVMVGRDLSIPGHAEAFAIGDMSHFEQSGKPLPSLSPVAMQSARAVARSIKRTLAKKSRIDFHYRDKGTMATIGRSRAIAQAGRIHLSGFVAWLAWLMVHIWFLIGFRNRIVVMLNWMWSYFTYGRGARLIVSDHPMRPAKPRSESIKLAKAAERALDRTGE